MFASLREYGNVILLSSVFVCGFLALRLPAALWTIWTHKLISSKTTCPKTGLIWHQLDFNSSKDTRQSDRDGMWSWICVHCVPCWISLFAFHYDYYNLGNHSFRWKSTCFNLFHCTARKHAILTLQIFHFLEMVFANNFTSIILSISMQSNNETLDWLKNWTCIKNVIRVHLS